RWGLPRRVFKDPSQGFAGEGLEGDETFAVVDTQTLGYGEGTTEGAVDAMEGVHPVGSYHLEENGMLGPTDLDHGTTAGTIGTQSGGDRPGMGTEIHQELADLVFVDCGRHTG